MKLTRNRLKELIRQSIREIDFEDEEAFKKYQSQHKMRPSTKVNIGGKETTVGKASKSKSKPGGNKKSIVQKYDTIFGDKKRVDKMINSLKTQKDAAKLIGNFEKYTEETRTNVRTSQLKGANTIISMMTDDIQRTWDHPSKNDDDKRSMVSSIINSASVNGVDAIISDLDKKGLIQPDKVKKTKNVMTKLVKNNAKALENLLKVQGVMNVVKDLGDNLPKSK